MSLEIWSALSRKVMHVVLASVIMDANSRPFPRPCLVETAKIVAAGCSPYSISFEKAFTISSTQAPIPISAIGIVHPV